MCANTSLFFKSALICSQSFSIATRDPPISFYRKPIKSAFKFSKIVRENQYIHHPIGKKEFKSCERIRPIRKRTQLAYALADFENLNEIQKLFAYPA